MDYKKAYVSLADKIRNQATVSMEEPVKNSLVRKPVEQQPLKTKPNVTEHYMKMVDQYFGTEGEAAGEIDSYLDTTDNTSEMAPDTSVRPKSSGDVPQGKVPEYIYKGLVERGLDPTLAGAMVMNIADESGFVHDIEEHKANVHGTKGKGLYQRTGSRRDSYVAQYGDDWSIDTQLDAFMDEINGPEKGSWEKVKANSGSQQEAAVAIAKHFLRPAKTHLDKRTQKYLRSSGYKPRSNT